MPRSHFACNDPWMSWSWWNMVIPFIIIIAGIALGFLGVDATMARLAV